MKAPKMTKIQKILDFYVEIYNIGKIMQNYIYHICIYQYAKTQSLTSLLKTVFLQDRQDKQSQIMREYNPTIQYANKEDHPTMAMNNILACP